MMSISSETSIQAYRLNSGGTRARMAILRMIAADSVHNFNPSTRLQPGDWRGARHTTMKSYTAHYATLDQGFNDEKTPIWYSHNGPEFRDERRSHEIVPSLCKGWFTDADAGETAIGIVSRLTHGRFIAGYLWTSNDERVYFPEVFNDEDDAARMADEHARVFAESNREDSERFNAMQDAEIAADDALTEFRRAFALRHHPAGGMDYARESLQALRDARESLDNANNEYERG